MASTVLKQKTGRPSKRQVAANRAKPKTATTDAVAILDKRFGSPESEAYMKEELERVLVGNQIYELRTKAGMTQAALAKKIGTGASAICRLEDADYESHTLPVLRKIATVFNSRLEIRFIPLEKNGTKKKPAAKSATKSKPKAKS